MQRPFMPESPYVFLTANPLTRTVPFALALIRLVFVNPVMAQPDSLASPSPLSSDNAPHLDAEPATTGADDNGSSHGPDVGGSGQSDKIPTRKAESEAESGVTEEVQERRVPTFGKIVDADSDHPVRGASVRVRGTSIVVTTDEVGVYRLPPLRQRIEMLEIHARRYQPLTSPVRIRENEELPTIRLTRLGQGDSVYSEAIEVVETIIEAPQTVERTLSLPELQRVPGSFNDAVRAVQNLPGVARSPIGFLIVRGTEPQDTGYYIDGIRIPQIFHLFGLHTVVNSDMLEKVTFLPGNYGVRYGRTYGGVVDAITTEDIPQKYSGYVGADLLNSVAFAKIPVRPNLGLYASVRRSYVDVVLDAAFAQIEKRLPEDYNLQLFQAPRYWDYQVLYNHQVTPRNFVHAMLFGSNDLFQIVGDPPASVHPDLRADGEVGADNSFHKGVVKWRYVGERLTSQVTVSFGPDFQRFTFGGINLEAKNYGLFAREDLSIGVKLYPHLKLRAGLDTLLGFYSFNIDLPFDPNDQSLDPLDDPNSFSRKLGGSFFFPSPYLEAEYELTPRISIFPGIRVDPFLIPGLYETLWIDPRLTMLWRIPMTTLFKASAGRYGENPQPFAVDPAVGGNPDLLAPYSLQYSVGVEHGFTPRITLEMTAFYSDLRRLVIIPQDTGGTVETPDFTNDGRGRNKGLELLLRHNPHNGFFGWISYTLQKAERLDGLTAATKEQCEFPTNDMQGVCWYPFDYDQTHILTLVASYDLPHQITIGAKFRYSTGLPFTPTEASYFDVDANTFEPIPAIDGIRNTSRVLPFHDLTLRIDKKARVKKVNLNAYLEVLNVYNRSNPEQVDYSFDYEEQGYIYGLPIFPNLGVKAEF